MVVVVVVIDVQDATIVLVRHRVNHRSLDWAFACFVLFVQSVAFALCM
jgi:hypothetical protein